MIGLRPEGRSCAPAGMQGGAAGGCRHHRSATSWAGMPKNPHLSCAALAAACVR